MRESVSTVGQEVELVRAYLNILQMRMGKRLAFEIDVPPELMDLAFPPLMLPSLVENAIKHGLEPQREGGEVRIRAEAVDDVLRMVVSDTGRGFAETVGGGGVGLTNIRERLAAMYGDRAQLTLEPREPHGVVATIAVPRSGARAAAAAAAPVMPEAPPAPKPETARTATARTLAAMGTAERAWRKGLSFTFIGLVVVAAIAAGLGVIGVVTGVVPVHIGDEPMGTASGALIGTAGIAVAFVVVVLALAIVLAVVYGLGFLLAGIAIFIPLVVLVSIFPVLAPFLLVGLGIWWLVRRHDRKVGAAAPAAQPPAR
jgi:histidine kinase/DNA gyrase B/HSP90-like ATPase